MRAGDDSLEPLRALIEELAAQDASEVLSLARADARERLRSTLTDALAEAMLERLHELLESRSSDTEPELDRSRGRSQSHLADELGPATAEDDRPDVPAAPRPERPVVVPPTGSSTDAAPPAAPGTDAAPEPLMDPNPLSGVELGWYVYGVIPAAALESRALDAGTGLTIVEEGGLAAVASSVPLADFEEDRLREHLGDLDWVEATARSHERVLQEVRRQTTVIPMRMCTVYRAEGGVRDMLRREARSLGEALSHLEGRTEWGVKAFLRAPEATASPDHEAGSPEPAPGLSPGAAYLESRRRERDREEQAAQAVDEARVEIHEQLTDVASDSVLLPVQAPDVTGRPGEMILNGAYLVEDDSYDTFSRSFVDLAGRFAPLGIELDMTGPWPPYNFVPGAIGAVL